MLHFWLSDGEPNQNIIERFQNLHLDLNKIYNNKYT